MESGKKNLIERLNEIEGIITQPDFLKNKGLGNEVGYYVFDYPAEEELVVRAHVNTLVRRLNAGIGAVRIAEFDLYDVVLDIIDSHGYLEKCFELERNEGTKFLFDEAIADLLDLSADENALIRYIVDALKERRENTVVFLTGLGKCFPFVRSHKILNNLHQKQDKFPVVLFFPGTWDGRSFNLFGTIKEDNYYRAFRLT